MSERDSRPGLACWCGNDRLAPFSNHYRRCDACQTLVAVGQPIGDVTRVADDEAGLYGRDYWFGHQQCDVGLPDIRARAIADLPERCVYWLRTLLRYKLPPARVQELGSAHGGFVALMRWAGFEAAGLELSPWIAQFARQTFDAPILQGPLESQSIPPGSLDALVLMDVLEHLPDPRATMTAGLRLLKPDGVIIVQTPAYPEGASFEALTASDDYFLNHLRGRHEEHLFLFSRQSARELFKRLGCPVVEFEPAIFRQYDMYFAASRSPLNRHSPAEVVAALTSSPSGRLVNAVLQAAGDRDDYLHEATARLQVIEGLSAEIDRLRAVNASLAVPAPAPTS